MELFKLTFLREINKPRLVAFQPYLELVTFIKAVNCQHAVDISKDIMKEHGFADYEVERINAEEFRTEVNFFLEDEDFNYSENPDNG